MSSMQFHEIGELKVGSYIMMDGAPCKITKMDRSAPGKHGHAKYRTEAVGLIDGQKRVQVIIGHSKVEVPVVEKKNAQVLSVSGKTAQLMDMESYQSFDAEIPDDLTVKEGEEVLYWELVDKRIIKSIKS